MLDPDAEHQIRLFLVDSKIGVTCNCMSGFYGIPNEYLKVAVLLPADEAIAVYRRHLEAVGG